MKSMFEMGIRRMDFFGNPAFGRPYLGQYDDEGIICGGPDNPCPPGSPGALQTVHPLPGNVPPPSGSDFLKDITTAASIILAPTKKPMTPGGVPAVAPAAPSSTAVLVGAGVLGAVIAGVLFLT